MAKIVIVRNAFLLAWARTVFVCCAGPSHPDAERVYAGMPNLAAAASYYLNSSLFSTYSRPWYSVYHDCKPLDLTCKTDARESFSHLGAAISTNSDTPTHTCSSSAAKKLHEEAEKEDGEQGAHKKQKTNTNTTATSTAAETNTALMDETEVCMAIKEFNRYFEDDTKILSYMSRFIMSFAEDLAQRGLASVHSSKIVELCMASEKWRGHNVFWRMLLFFMDTMSLEVVEVNRLEDKKTVVLRDRKIRDKPLSEYPKDQIYRNIAKFRGAERMEMQCSLNVLKDRGTADVLGVLRWLLHHVNIRCVGITCDLTEVGMNSAMFGRQVEALSKEWRGSRMRIDSLTLRFNLAHYKNAAVIAKECPCISVLKIHFIGAGLWLVDDRNQALEALLLYSPALKELSVVGLSIGIEHIQTIVAMVPQLVLLEVEFLTLDKVGLYQKEERENKRKEAPSEFPNLSTLKTSGLYNCADSIENLACVFPNLEYVQIPSRYVTTSLIDALSSLHLLRSLETVNGTLSTETIEYLLDKLSSLECLSVGVDELDSKLVHALSKCTGMHTLNLRGIYIPGFLASLLQPSPLMSTLKVLCVYRHFNIYYRRGKLSTKDLSSKKDAMKNFGCAVEIRQ
ncbi:hypothetical protein NECID01_2049 [Nematocida sp. AWRm77]|nr:hypothetical protein NECID01_2049 [Nematocida sp. AWRm77]